MAKQKKYYMIVEKKKSKWDVNMVSGLLFVNSLALTFILIDENFLFIPFLIWIIILSAIFLFAHDYEYVAEKIPIEVGEE